MSAWRSGFPEWLDDGSQRSSLRDVLKNSTYHPNCGSFCQRLCGNGRFHTTNLSRIAASAREHQASVLRHAGVEYIQSCLGIPDLTLAYRNHLFSFDERQSSYHLPLPHSVLPPLLSCRCRSSRPIPGTWSSQKPLCSCPADTLAHDKSSMGKDGVFEDVSLRHGGGAKKINVNDNEMIGSLYKP